MKNALIAAALFAGAALPASAATLSVGSLPSGFYGSTTVVLPEATLVSGGDNFYFGGASNVPGSFCATSGYSCQADLTLTFASAVANLSFNVSGADAGDNVLLSIFNGASLLGQLTFTFDTVVDLSSYGAITGLFFDDSSSGAGVAYSNFSFDTVQVAPVPVPAALPLLAAALGGLAVARRRKA